MDITVQEINKNLEETNIKNQNNASYEDTVILEEFSETFDALKDHNCFKLTTSMVKVMEGQKGGGFYAAILQDRGTRNNQIGVVIEYPDRGESELLKFSQGEFIQAGRNQFQQVTYIKGIQKIKEIPFVKKFEDTLMEYMSPDMPIWPSAVIRTIYEKYDKLPVIEAFSKAPDMEEIYKYLSGFALELSTCEDKGYINHKDFYRFTSDDLTEAAEGLWMKLAELLAVLRFHGLINRTPHSIGDQTKIRYKNNLFYTYNICRQPSTVQVNVRKNVNGEFPTAKFDVKYLSPKERHRFEKDEAEKKLVAKMNIKDWTEKELFIEFGLVDKKDIIPENCKVDVIITDESSKGSKFDDIEIKSDESSKSSKSVDAVEIA